MATVRKREWTTSKGERRQAFVVSYTDQRGKRHIETYAKERDATAARIRIEGEVVARTHTPRSDSATVADAAAAWLRQAETDKLERSTVRQYAQHVRLHILPLLGRVKLADLSIASVKTFRNGLIERGNTVVMARKVVSSLGSILADAMESGLVARNIVHEAAQLSRKHANRHKRVAARRQAKKIVEGVDYPTKDELRAMLAVDSPRYGLLLDFAISSGLRASELRGLEWQHVDLDKAVCRVEQRADRWNEIGNAKSAAGNREIPLSHELVLALREWKLRCPRRGGELVYVFPNTVGNVETLPSLHNRCLVQIQRAAGIVRKDAKAPKYGMHSLRHVAISLWIEAGFTPKRVQALAGHSTIGMTFDVYGHLWRSDDSAAMSAVRARLLG